MKVLKQAPTVYCDVDDTLIKWNYDSNKNYPNVRIDGIYYQVNSHITTLLVELKKRGHNIVVWSQSGSEWAERVVRALLLHDVVDIVSPKPHIYLDDIANPIVTGKQIGRAHV